MDCEKNNLSQFSILIIFFLRFTFFYNQKYNIYEISNLNKLI